VALQVLFRARTISRHVFWCFKHEKIAMIQCDRDASRNGYQRNRDDAAESRGKARFVWLQMRRVGVSYDVGIA
jgi:hypothetical protein